MKQRQQDRVLILNQSYEPIGTMAINKAMCKIARPDSSLQILEWARDYKNPLSDGTFADRIMTSPSGPYPVPSVLRLLYRVDMVKNRNKSSSKRERIYTRDKYKCQYCGLKLGQVNKHLEGGARPMTKHDLTLDHIMPQSRDGETVSNNLVTSCKPCNQKKGARTPEEARMPLLISKTLLKANLNAVAICNYAEACPEWKRYIFHDNKGDENHSHVGDESFG